MILTYHKVDPNVKTEWWVSPDAFYLQMLDLRSKKVVYLDDYDPLDASQCVITFDGVYENVWKYAIPILKYFGYPFELFVIGKYMGKDNQFDIGEPPTIFAGKDTLLKMVRAGGRLQWHTWSHQSLEGPHSKEKYKRELTVPEEFREMCPEGFKWFAYPHGRWDEAYRSQVKLYFKGALACDQDEPTDRYNLERVTVFEKSRFANTTVSVIIPCYNYGQFAAEAIESVLTQTYPPDEILFIDDASSDNSVEVAKRYEPFIRIETNPRNLGIIGNFTKAVDMTTGDYVCFLGADNRFRADYIEKCKAVLDAYPDVGVAYTHFVLFDKRAAAEALRTGAKPHPIFPDFFLLAFSANPDKDIREENYIHGSSMYRRKAYSDAGGYSEGNLPEDHSLFARMLDHGWKAKLVDDFILEYRQHSKDQINFLKSLEIENVYLRAQHQSLLHQFAERDYLLAEKDKAVNTLSEQLREIIIYKDALLAEKDKAVNTLSEQLREFVMYKDSLLAEKDQAVNTLSEQLREIVIYKDALLAEKEHAANALSEQLQEITISRAWRVATWTQRVSQILFPAGTWRAKLGKKLFAIIIFPVSLQRYFRMRQDLSLLLASRFFDEAWYIERNPDVAHSGMDPARHYLLFGGFEGRDPGPGFSNKWYLDTYKDVLASNVNPLVHYLKYGQKEGRLSSDPGQR